MYQKSWKSNKVTCRKCKYCMSTSVVGNKNSRKGKPDDEHFCHKTVFLCHYMFSLCELVYSVSIVRYLKRYIIPWMLLIHHFDSESASGKPTYTVWLYVGAILESKVTSISTTRITALCLKKKEKNIIFPMVNYLLWKRKVCCYKLAMTSK